MAETGKIRHYHHEKGAGTIIADSDGFELNFWVNKRQNPTRLFDREAENGDHVVFLRNGSRVTLWNFESCATGPLADFVPPNPRRNVSRRASASRPAHV